MEIQKTQVNESEERDAIDSYFDCVTACSIDEKGIDCVTRCVEVHLKADV